MDIYQGPMSYHETYVNVTPTDAQLALNTRVSAVILTLQTISAI